MFSSRTIRRRWILAVFFLCIPLYFVYRNLQKDKEVVVDVYQVQHSVLRQPFQWQPKLPDVEPNSTKTFSCRNSVQGKLLIVDERGYVCTRNDINQRDCCDTKSASSSRYNCSTCKPNSCCVLYEHCISCCLHPEKQPLLQRVLQQARESVDKLFESVSDHFELCLAKCRTSSRSVQHENSYRDSKAKHCYGEDPPDLQMVVT